jgi:hypothetical protein
MISPHLETGNPEQTLTSEPTTFTSISNSEAGRYFLTLLEEKYRNPHRGVYWRLQRALMRRSFQAKLKAFLPKTIFNTLRCTIRSCDLIFTLPARLRKFSTTVQEKWFSESMLFRRIFQNLIIGIGICVILALLHNTALIRKAEDAGLDWMMKMYRGVKPIKGAIAYTLLDIDEETYQAWGEPLITPRDKLLKLIHYASKGEPKIIIIDIDLSRRFGEYDGELFDFINTYGKLPDENDQYMFHVSPIILARAFKNVQNQNGRSFAQQRSSFLDSAVKDNQFVFWGSSLFEIDSDQVIRKWRLFENSCLNGEIDLVPSIQLLSLSLLSGDKPFLDKFRTHFSKDNSIGCETDIAMIENILDIGDIDVGGKSFSMNPKTINRRVFFEIPWILKDGEHRPQIPHKESYLPLLSVRSAYKITEATRPIDSNWLNDQVVVIGASYLDSRDIHQTPIGAMPGTMVLINALHSMISYGVANTPPLWIKLLMGLLLIILISMAFSFFNSFWGMFLSGGLIILAIMPLSFLFFRSGVWLDFAAPLTAIQLHQIAARIEEYKKKSNPFRESINGALN